MKTDATSPLLVLGLGNLLLEDDAVGLELLARVRARSRDPRVEFVDGGTQGIALGAHFAGRRAALLLDAVRLGAAPGTVHRLREPASAAPPRGDSAHGANAGELLATVTLVGDLPPFVEVLGIEPGSTRTGIGLSPNVRRALRAAVAAAEHAIAELLAHTVEPSPCPKPT